MKKKILASVITLITGCLLFSPKTHASIFALQPRLEAGLMHYSIELAALSETTLPNAGNTTGHNSGHDKIKFSDNMGFVGCGATFFIHHLFVDLSAQFTVDGNARSQDSVSEYGEATNSLTTITTEDEAQFDRTDRALSIGYAITRRFSVYAGYKWATLHLDNTFDGQVSYLNIDNYVLNGHISGLDHYEFEYNGPFVGMTNGWEMGRGGFFSGLITAKLALAYLNSNLLQNETGTAMFDSINGTEVDPESVPFDDTKTTKGTTWGLALGLDWRGATPIGNLAYCIGVSGYRFNFNSDDSSLPDISETSVIFKVGLSYAY
jgi:hypothetical protein